MNCRSVAGNSIADHLVYFGVELMCETWRSCGIVMDSLAKEYGKMDVKGNMVFSRDSILRMKTHTNIGGDQM